MKYNAFGTLGAVMHNEAVLAQDPKLADKFYKFSLEYSEALNELKDTLLKLHKEHPKALQFSLVPSGKDTSGALLAYLDTLPGVGRVSQATFDAVTVDDNPVQSQKGPLFKRWLGVNGITVQRDYLFNINNEFCYLLIEF